MLNITPKPFLVLTLLIVAFGALHAQVKIGDNYQDVSPYALLELESKDKALLLPRMNDAERDAAFGQDAPVGVVIFNTDSQVIQFLQYEKDKLTGRYTDRKVWMDVEDQQIYTDDPPAKPEMGDLFYDSKNNQMLVWDADLDTGIQAEETADEDKIRFDTAGEQRMIIDQSGNIGIGTTTPTYPFELITKTTSNTTLTNSQIELNDVPSNGTWTTLISDVNHSFNITPLALRFASTYMGTTPLEISFSVSNTTANGIVEANSTTLINNLKTAYWLYRIDDNYVKALRVEFRLNNTSLEVREQAARYRTGSSVPVSNQTDAYFSGSGWTNSIYSFDIVRVGFYDNLLPTLVAREDKVGIGTASPTERLDVDGQARVRTLNFATAGTVSVVVATTSGVLQSISSEQLLTGVTANVGIGTAAPDQTLSVNGNASKVGGGSWATFSDQRVKTGIKPYRKGLMELLQINPVQYRYNKLSGYDDTRTQHVGVLAQEIEQILPSTVTTFDDSDGPSGLSDKRQFDPSELLWTTINAIKELKAKNDSLQAENEALKARLKRIEAVLGIE